MNVIGDTRSAADHVRNRRHHFNGQISIFSAISIRVIGFNAKTANSALDLRKTLSSNCQPRALRDRLGRIGAES